MFVALLVGMPPALADQNDPRLDTLFALLQEDAAEHSVKIVESRIWSVWHESDSATVSLLLSRGTKAMHENRYDVALRAFDSIVELQPDFAEGWNKRATLYFLMGRYRDSLADVEKTLELEPRHFGALSGLGMIYTKLEQDENALEAYEQALAVNPHLQQAKSEVRRLRKKVLGNRI